MSDPFIYYVENADTIYRDQLSFRFASCSRQDDTVMVTEDLKKYCNLIDSTISNYLKAKSIKDVLLGYKRRSENKRLTREEEEKIYKLREIRQSATYMVNTYMKKISEFADTFSQQYYTEKNDCEYIAKYDNEKKIWKFIKKE